MILENIPFTTEETSSLVDITKTVRQFVESRDVKNGLCIVYSPHTTASVTITTISDHATAEDILDEFNRLVPVRATFAHTLDTPADAAGHIKVVLVGNSVMLPVKDGKLVIGHSQYILFFEFDGPRDREIMVQILRDAD